ncbi:hypothetical protein ACFOZ7_13470 [Natribaculum luteum]|uniref:Uncharacterized protein n=1 Tax=Natribaculum luteum TaxID=1586232 RepID=A0ABD5P0S9_9EURY|nr:hypothetical protein [Natribaculum luteum]
MTGFKSGSAGDPFSSSDTDDDSGGGEAGNDESATIETSASTSMTEPDDESGSSTDRDDRGETTSSASGTVLPWIYERNSITDGRAQTVQLHLQQSTLDRQREGKRETEAMLGESVKKADLREAALLVGLEHIDEVAEQLREWGYDFE